MFVLIVCRGFIAALVFFLAQASVPTFAVGQPDFEYPGDLTAEQLLPESLRIGEYHQLESRVQNDGLFNHYLLNSSFGRFEIKTTTLLKIRIREINAITAMREIKTSDTAVEGLKNSGKGAVIGAKNLLTHPVKTIGNAASAVEQLYTRATATVRRNAGETESSAFSQMVGLARLKGEIASRFGVNMYSRNPVLQQELDRLAQASFLGGLSVKVATSVASSFAPMMGSVLLSTSGAAQIFNDMINSTPPAEMWLQNKRKLQAMGLGLDEDKIENFLNRAVFSPAMQTVLVASLEALDGVQNRVLFIQLALEVSDESRAKLIAELAVMSAAYHKNIRPLEKFMPMAKLLSAVNDMGAVVVLMPADYMIWSESNARVMNLMSRRANEGLANENNAGPQLWVLGNVSGKTRSHLLSRRWHVHTHAGQLLQPR